MPRIPQQYLDAVVYMYPSQEDAEKGRPFGGTGFLCGNGGDNAVSGIYIVTNAHVAKAGRCNVVRVNFEGVPTLVHIEDRQWVRHADGDDVAAAKLRHSDMGKLHWLNTQGFISEQFIRHYDVRPGMDTFMVGRLIGLDGLRQTNASIRFGHLAMMPEPVLTEVGLRQESFLVEMWSLPGYSGSPVFIVDSQPVLPGDQAYRFWDTRLLGINCGHYLHPQKGAGAGCGLTAHVSDNRNSGFAIVVPAWKISELLSQQELSCS